MSSSSNLETRSIIDELRNFDKSGLFDLGHPLLNRIAESFVKAAGIGAVQAVAREAYLTAVEGAGADASGIPPEISAAKRHRFPDLRGIGLVYGPLDQVLLAHAPCCLYTNGLLGAANRIYPIKHLKVSRDHKSRAAVFTFVTTFKLPDWLQSICHSGVMVSIEGETNAKTVEALVKGTGKESLQWGLAAGMYSGLTYGLKEARGVHDWKNSALAGAVTGAALALTSDGHSHEQIVQCAITGAAISTAANLLRGIF